jgi:hypothetical protein
LSKAVVKVLKLAKIMFFYCLPIFRHVTGFSFSFSWNLIKHPLECGSIEALTHPKPFSILFTVVKFIAFILIASICIDTISAAPVANDQTAPSKKPRNPHRKNPLKKNFRRKGIFEGINETIWQNPCNGQWIPGMATSQDYDESYRVVS